MNSLCSETGLSRLRLRCILEAAGVEIRSEPRLTRTENRYRNNHLVAMGARLYAERVKRNWSMAEMAIALGISEPHLGEALQGLYNWKFVEMARAATTIGIPVCEFMRLPQETM